MVEFDQSKIESQIGSGRPGIQFLRYLKADQVAPRAFHPSEPDAVVIGNLKHLPRFHSQNPSEVVGIIARNFGGTAVDLIYKKSPSCHVQYLRKSEFVLTP
jgi:hypothetical protein